MWRNTDCRTVSELLWNYTTHRLSEQEIERVERHLDLCGPCRAEAEAYTHTTSALRAIQREPIPDSRRGWHELQARLSAPPERQSILPAVRWMRPQLAFGSLALAAALCVVFMRPPLEFGTQSVSRHGNAVASVPGPQVSESAVDQADPLVGGYTYDDLMPLKAGPSHSEITGHSRRPGRATGGWIQSPHSLRPSMKMASAAPYTVHARPAGWRSRRRSETALDFNHVDGRNRQQGTSDANNYVLTPVSTSSESDNGADYVMGSIIMASRSGDTEEARGL